VKRVLLIGGSGQLGTAISARWRDCEIAAPSHEELPIENTERLCDALEGFAPDVVVNAAAFHDVDRCEVEPQRAMQINALAVGAAARAAARRDAIFVTLSSDYVFDGLKDAPYVETDAPAPLSRYGASKLAGERLVAESGARSFVVRTCGVYGPARSRSRRTFIERVLTQGEDEAPLRIVADVVASPTFAGDLADLLRELVGTRAYGLYHAAGAGAVSWYEFACEALRQAGIAPRIEPIAASQWSTRAPRPRFSALENARLAELGLSLPPWRAGIAAYLALGVT
jgi:dTDP-4-dehydrorhamnose reductase